MSFVSTIRVLEHLSSTHFQRHQFIYNVEIIFCIFRLLFRTEKQNDSKWLPPSIMIVGTMAYKIRNFHTYLTYHCKHSVYIFLRIEFDVWVNHWVVYPNTDSRTFDSYSFSSRSIFCIVVIFICFFHQYKYSTGF